MDRRFRPVTVQPRRRLLTEPRPGRRRPPADEIPADQPHRPDPNGPVPVTGGDDADLE